MALIGLLTATEKQVHLFRLHETHTVASRKQLEGTRISRKSDIYSQITAPLPTVVAGGRQHSRSTITPNKACSADLYRCIKRRVGHSLRQAHCKRNLVPESKLHINYLELKAIFLALKEFQDLCRQDSSCSKRQHHSCVIHKQGRRHEVGPNLCPAVENLDLVYQKSDSRPNTFQAG